MQRNPIIQGDNLCLDVKTEHSIARNKSIFFSIFSYTCPKKSTTAKNTKDSFLETTSFETFYTFTVMNEDNRVPSGLLSLSFIFFIDIFSWL